MIRIILVLVIVGCLASAGVMTLPHHWASKPPLGAQINWGHPLAAGLVDVMLMNEGSGAPYSLVQRDVATANGAAGVGPTWTAGQNGIRRTYVVASTQHDDWVNNSNRQITGALTIHVGLFCTTGNDSTIHEVFTKRPNSGTTDYEWDLAIYNDGTNGPYFSSHNGSFSTIETVGSFTPQNTFSTLSATRSPAGTSAIVYINGVSRASGSTIAPVTTSSSVSIGATNGAQLPLGGSVYFAYLWNRQLGASEISWLNADPYAFIEPSMPMSKFFTSTGVTNTVRHRITNR